MNFDWVKKGGTAQIVSMLQKTIIKMKREEDSFEECKRALEEQLGLHCPPPSKPMNAYMRFFFERSCEERSKGNPDWKKLTSQITEEWKGMSASRRDYYTKMFEIRVRERNSLFEEWNRLTHKKRPLAPYQRYVQKRYPQYAKENPNLPSSEINKLIKKDWERLGDKEKRKLQAEFQREKDLYSHDYDNSDKIEQYKERLARYHDQLREDKEKIEKKYGITKRNKASFRNQEKKQQRQRKKAQKQLEKAQKAKQAREKKLQAKADKVKKEKERAEQRKVKTEKQEAKKAKNKAKVEASEKKRPASRSVPKVKVEPKAPKVKKATPKKAAVKVEKNKIIKKAPKVKAAPKKAAKPAVKPKPKVKAKAKPKAKAGRRGRR